MSKGIIIMSNSTHTGAHKALYEMDKHLSTFGIEISFLFTKKKLFQQIINLTIKNFFFLKADFIVFNSTAALKAWQSRYIFYAAQITGKKIFIYFRETEEHLKWDQRNGLLNAINWYMSKNITVLTNSFVTHKMVNRTKHLSKGSNVGVIYAGNCAFIDDINKQNTNPKQYVFLKGIEKDIPIIINLGCAMQWIKGLKIFIETAITACRMHPNAVFLWLGEGPERNWALERVRQENLQSRILLPGYIDEPSSLLNRARLVFITSQYESFSQVTAQAMYYAKDIVIMEGSGGPEELLSGLPHTSIKPDPAAAAKTIITILNNKAISHKSLKIAYEESYSPQAHAQRLSAIFNSH